MINNITSYWNPDGTPTVDGLRLDREREARIRELEARVADMELKFAAIAAVTGPTGGATIDSQARTAINAVISGAA